MSKPGTYILSTIPFFIYSIVIGLQILQIYISPPQIVHSSKFPNVSPQIHIIYSQVIILNSCDGLVILIHSFNPDSAN
jgi:hypothetical protein